MINKLLLSLVIVCTLWLTHSRSLDEWGLQATEAGFSRALLTFGISRALNGVISVVQGTEVAVEPVGIGMTFTPGQILDPVNDLVERFSTLVLVAGTAFGVQRVALEALSGTVFNLIVSASLVLVMLLIWYPKKQGGGFESSLQQSRNLIVKSAILLVILRFSVPVLAIGGELFYSTFLEQQFTESTAKLQQTSDDLSELKADVDASQTQAESGSFLQGLKQLGESVSKSLDVEQHLEDFNRAAESVSEHALRLMVVFVFQTLVLPIASIWLTLKSIRLVLFYRRQKS